MMKVTYLPGQIEEMHQLFNPLCSPYHQLISQGIYFHQHLYSWPIGATTADGVQVKRRATQKAKNINNIQFQRHSFPWFMAFLCKSTDSIQQMVVTANSAAATCFWIPFHTAAVSQCAACRHDDAEMLRKRNKSISLSILTPIFHLDLYFGTSSCRRHATLPLL